MYHARRITLAWEVLLKRSWPLLVAGAACLILMSSGLYWFALSGKARRIPLTAATTTGSAVTYAATSTERVARSLDGVVVDAGNEALLPFAVMLDNLPEARPISGLALANLVFELPVEGGATRYLAVFDAATRVEQIGPVRSARPYAIELADGLQAMFAHVGGSPEALDKLQRLRAFRDLNQYWNGRFFWRAQKRLAPHNVYTRSDLLTAAARVKKFSPGQFNPWKYKADDQIKASSTVRARGVEDGPRVSFGGQFNVAWSYDRSTNQYVRSLAGERQKDLDGQQVWAKNVVVMLTDGHVLDTEGRLRVRTIGIGHATLYRDGQKHELGWKRTAGQHIQIMDVEGSEAEFNRGTTWIEVVTDPTIIKTD